MIPPTLKIDDILGRLADLGIDMTQVELDEPSRHRDTVRQMWVELLSICTGKEEDSVVPESWKEASKNKALPDFHDNVGDIYLFRCLRHVLMQCGYNNFGLSDLTLPTKERLQAQVSVLLYLADFIERKTDLYGAVRDWRKPFYDEIDENVHKSKLLEKEKEETVAVVAEDKKQLDKLKKECEELAGKITIQNKLQASARAEVNTLKRRIKDLSDDLATTEWNLQEIEAEEEKLRGQVVTSPDRRKAEVLAAREELNKVKDDVSKVDEASQGCKKGCRNLKLVLKDVTTVTENLKEFQTDCERHSEMSRKLEDALHDVTAKQNKQKALTEEIEEAERAVGRAEVETESQRKQHQIQTEALEEAIESAKNELLKVEKERREGMMRLRDWEEQVARLEAEINEVHATTDRETEQMIAEYKTMEEEFLAVDQKRMGQLTVSHGEH